jgi:hypothetical protein
MSDKPPAPYPIAWARIQRAKRRVAVGCFGFVGCILLVDAIVPRHSPIRWLMFVPTVFGLAVMIVYLARIRCPNCGERIMLSGRLSRLGPDSARLSDGKCSHCGTQIGPNIAWFDRQ